MYGTSTLPALNGSAPAKGVLLALDGNTMDLVVQMGPTVEVVAQDSNGDYVFKVYERFALRLKDKNAVVELDFVPKKSRARRKNRRRWRAGLRRTALAT